jgi:Holliday junction resolvase RusA-like endonuclease
MDEITLVVKHAPTKSTHQSALRVMRRRGGGGFFVGKYEKSEIKQWTALFAESIRPYKPSEPWDCPVHAEIYFFFPWPKHVSQKKKDQMSWKLTKPDLDNSEKTILDTLTKEGFLRDDSIICSKKSQKHFSDEPKVVVFLQKIS